MKRGAPSLLLASIATTALLAAPRARAGWYLEPEMKWAAYSLRPVASEATPNYYAIGGSLAAGYSMAQTLDLGFFGQDLPGTLKRAQFGKADATLVSYGGEAALRIGETVYLGFRGGPARLAIKRTGDAEPPALTQANGVTYGVALGAIAKLSKTSFLQTTFEMMQYNLTTGDPTASHRTLDQFAVGLAYLYNSVGEGSALESRVFRDFLRSLSF